jgi:hypothetical protein
MRAAPQAEARSGRLLGRKERLKETASRFRAHAAASVAHSNAQTAAAADPVSAFADAKSQVASARHGIEGIAHEVRQHLAQFGNIAVNPGYDPIFPHHVNPHRLTSVFVLRERFVRDVMNRDRFQIV